MNDRIYVCHTFYHVYITLIKELNLPEEDRGNATLVLSHMSNDFGTLPDRIRKLNFFQEVVDFDEKPETFFPELARYREPGSNFVKNLFRRILFTRKFARLEAPFIPVDFKDYRNIYVFCDSDPIGFYLNQYKIPYHAVEDGLNCLHYGDLAHYDNRGHFPLKAFLSQKCNLIFIQNGYGKYCLDMEVNDISLIEIPFEKYIEVPRKKLLDNLDTAQKEFLFHAFVEDAPALHQLVENQDKKTALILTEPLCSLPVRKQIFEDLIQTYGAEYEILLKPHPRDELDYPALFPNVHIIPKTVPMEMLNFISTCKIDLAISVFTELEALTCVEKKLRLGPDFMDQYEDPEIHRIIEKLHEAFPTS